MALRPTVLRSSGASLVILRMAGDAPVTLRASDNQGTAARTKESRRERLNLVETRVDSFTRQTYGTQDPLDELLVLADKRERDTHAMIVAGVVEELSMQEDVVIGAVVVVEPRFEVLRITESTTLAAAYAVSMFVTSAARDSIVDDNPLLAVDESLLWRDAVTNYFDANNALLEFPTFTESGTSRIVMTAAVVEALGFVEVVILKASEKFVEPVVESIPFLDGIVTSFSYAPSVVVEAYRLNEFTRDGDGQVLIEFESDAFYNAMSGFTDHTFESVNISENMTASAVVSGANIRTEAYAVGEVRTDSYHAAAQLTENVNENLALVWAETRSDRMIATTDTLTELLLLSVPGMFEAPAEYYTLSELSVDSVSEGLHTTDNRYETYSVTEDVITSGNAGINAITELIPLSSGG